MHLRILGLAVLLVTCPVGVASAGLVYINSGQVTVGPAESSAGSARYLLSHTNYDQNLFNGVGNLNASNIRTANLGNVAALTQREFTFTLENRAGQGLLFTLSSPAVGSYAAINSTIAWGTFSSSVPGAVAQIGGVSPGAAFNTISITANATRANSSLAFSDFVFTSPTLSIEDGAFYSGVSSTGSVAGNATGSLSSPDAPPVTPFNTYTQLLAATENLAGNDWLLAGRVTGTRDVAAGGDASVALTVSLSQASVTAQSMGGGSFGAVMGVPEPTAAVALMALPGILLLRRRRVVT